ncbi:MAG: L,D-transpeptidase family protein [bacterium]
MARSYGLGFNEIQILHPDLDPWIPPPGTDLEIPTQWVLPPSRRHGIVINLPEMRLYRFYPAVQMVATYPVGIGDAETPTPEGDYRIVSREVDPTWVIPQSLRAKYDVRAIPPGPDNPLGQFWLGLSLEGYGIHGTDFPWCVGRMISYGCIRLYPEDIEPLYRDVPAGMPVEIVYEPVKIGFKEREIFVEIHPDVYGRFPDFSSYALQVLSEEVRLPDVFMDLFWAAVERSDGMPVAIGALED